MNRLDVPIAQFADIVVLGEVHGNSAGPAALWAMAAAQLEARRCVTIGIEAAESDNDLFEQFVVGAVGHQPLLEGEFFSAPMFDGRASIAMLELLKQVRKARQTGADIRLFGFLRSGLHEPKDQNPHEQRMANALTARIEPGRPLVALVGNLHARRTAWDLGRGDTRPMAARVADVAELDTVELVYAGGESWAQVAKHGLQKIALQPWPEQDATPGLRRVERPEFDWEWGVGETTASPQAQSRS